MAKCDAISASQAASTLTAKYSASRNTGALDAARDRLHSTMGGSSDTEVKELTVMPAGRPPLPKVVTRHTPVGKRPSALRKSRASNSGRGSASGSSHIHALNVLALEM